jgi:hypothetical protein
MTTTQRTGEAPSAVVSQRQASYPITYDGREFAKRHRLAKHLTEICGTGHSLGACAQALRRCNEDADRALADLRRIAEKATVSIVVNGRSYKDQAALARHLHHYYGVHPHTVIVWMAPSGGGLSPDKAVDRAKQWAAKYRIVERSDPIMLFGWEFRSLRAACFYYRHPYTEAQRRRWKEHLAAGKPAYEFFLETLTRLWQRDLLDDRNRYRREDIAHRPAWSRPRNERPYPILDPGEVRFVNAEQPPEADTFPRHCRNEVLRLRERVNQMDAAP